LKPNRLSRAFRRRLFAGALLAVLLYLLPPGVLLIAEEQNDLAKLSSLNKKLVELYQAGKFNEAIPIAQEALELSKKALGPDHPQTAGALDTLARLYYFTGDYARAEPLYQRTLQIAEKALGPDHPDTATALSDLALLYRSTGNYTKAEPLYRRALEIKQKALGPDDPGTATTLNNLALLYRFTGDYDKAEPLYRRALEIKQKALGPDDPGTATTLNNLAELYRAKGDYAEAEPLCQRAVRIAEKSLGPDHRQTAAALSSLAALYLSTGDYDKAEPLCQRVLKIAEKALGPDHPQTAAALNNLAELYHFKGDYAKAQPLLKRALEIDEKALGPDHPQTAAALNNLAELYHFKGDYAKAEPLYRRVLRIDQKALGPDHPDTATALNNLAQLYRATGDYDKAEPLYQRALQIDEKALGPDHPDTARGLNNLAELYRAAGDYAKAEPLYQRAVRIAEKSLGPDHPQTDAALSSLATLYLSIGDYAKAEPLFERVVRIDEKSFGPNHPDTARGLNNLAELYRAAGHYAKAEPLYRRALRIAEKSLGPDHPDTAAFVNNLALLYQSTGDYAKAEPLYQRALKILEKALGPDHPDTAMALENLVGLKIDLGEAKEAIPLVEKARQAQEKYLSNILSFTSERQRLAFQKTTHPYSLSGTLGLAAELAQTLLRQKGVVLDSLLEDRLVAEASSDPKQREIIEQLRAAKQGLMQLGLEVPKDVSEAAQKQRALKKEKLSTEVERLEGGFARKVAGLDKARRALSVTVPQVQSVLPKQAVLIELLRYSHYLGKGKFETRYGAVVIPASGEPKWVPLGAAGEIQGEIKLYQQFVRRTADERMLANVLMLLEELVWAPIEKALPEGCTTVIVSPDGELNFVSFATLLTPDDRFLGEKYSISYVASGRDLLRESKASGDPTTVVFANPAFESQAIIQATASSSPVASIRSLEMRDLQNMRLAALPGTKEEAVALEKRAGKATKIFLGPNATEAELRQVTSPRVLHLATHGFFLPEVELRKQNNAVLQPMELGKQTSALQPQPGEIPKAMRENPMYRSGLLLAGAQRTREAWSAGEVPPIENDGIVTAEEVGGLKLNGTWLVVLSACETGSGEARAGEGVMGLRRGFIQAGEQNLLMTLWSISDRTTVNIMLDFYGAAEKSHNAPQALAEVQRTWLVKLRKERGLSAAVKLAGPFIMSSQGKP
jgi:tetratricopeptide (TPR) repeat protein